jgi:hypothetical protein
MSALSNYTVLTLIIAIIAAVSGWATVAYQYFSDKPKVRGKILQVMHGSMTNPMKTSEKLATFVLFLYLTNARKNAVHLRNYELEVDVGKGYKKMLMVRGILDSTSFTFESESGDIIIPDFNKGLIYRQSKPVEYGVPFYGYLMFAGDIEYYAQKVRRCKIILTDVFDHKHKLTTKQEEFVDIFYLQEIFNIRFPSNIPLKPAANLSQTNTNLISGNEVK